MPTRYCATCCCALPADDTENDLCTACRAGVMTQDLAIERRADSEAETVAAQVHSRVPADPYHPQAGQILGDRYELKRELGRGGMGMVWLAYDGDLNLDVAIKLLPPDVARDRRAQEELKKEAQRSISLSHPNIVKLHTYRNQGDLQYLVMEFVDGPTLDHYLYDHGAVDEKQVAQWLYELCSGLAEAHRQGVIHRDIKPHNILLGADGRVKIADFGIARAVTDSTLRASSGISGTPLYMSPEQIRGQTCDSRSDLYSLGVAAYQLLSGDVPFRSGDVAYQHMHVAPDPIGDKAPLLWPVVEKLLAKDPVSRIESADVLAEMLEQTGLVQGRGVLSGQMTAKADRVPARTLDGGAAKPPRRAYAWAAAAVLAVVGGWLVLRAAPPTDSPVPPALSSTPMAQDHSTAAALPADGTATSPAAAITGEPRATGTPADVPAAPASDILVADRAEPEPQPQTFALIASVPPDALAASGHAAATALPAALKAIPAADVLAIAYGAYPPEGPVGTPSPALQLELFAMREGDAAFKVLADGEPLSSGVDDYVIMARALSPGYLYIFQIDSMGNKYWLFPRNDQLSISGGSNPVAAGQILQIPGDDAAQALYLDDTVGVEHVYAIYSAAPWPELEAALGEAGAQTSVSPGSVLPSETPDSADVLAMAATPPAAVDVAAGTTEPVSGRYEVAMAITEPNRLATRGIGGVRPAPAETDTRIALQGEVFPVTVASQAFEAEGSFLVVERWFRHVAPE